MPGNVSKSHEVQNSEVHRADDFDACERADCQKVGNKGRTAKTTSTSDGPTEVGRDATEYDAFEIVQEFSDELSLQYRSDGEIDETPFFRLMIDKKAEFETLETQDGFRLQSADSETQIIFLNDGSLYIDSGVGEPRALEDFIELNLGEHGLDLDDFDFEISMDSGDDNVFELDGFDPLAPFLIAEQYGESLSQADVQSALAGDVLERLAFMLGDIEQEALVDNAPDALAQAAASELVSMLETVYGDGIYDESGALSANAMKLLKNIAMQDVAWLPQPEFVTAQTLGNNHGAFGVDDDGDSRIFINEGLPLEAQRQAYLEEAGHFFDVALLGSGVELDTFGDEGELFRLALTGELYSDDGSINEDLANSVRAASADTKGDITVNGETLNVEFMARSSAQNSVQLPTDNDIQDFIHHINTGGNPEAFFLHFFDPPARPGDNTPKFVNEQAFKDTLLERAIDSIYEDPSSVQPNTANTVFDQLAALYLDNSPATGPERVHTKTSLAQLVSFASQGKYIPSDDIKTDLLGRLGLADIPANFHVYPTEVDFNIAANELFAGLAKNSQAAWPAAEGVGDDKKNAWLVHNGQMYRTDEIGRVVEIRAETYKTSSGRQENPIPNHHTNDIGRFRDLNGYHVNPHAKNGDMGFHLLGDDIGGKANRLNVVPGNGGYNSTLEPDLSNELYELNTYDYKYQFEEMQRLLLTAGYDTDVTFTLNYPSDSVTTRPEEIELEYTYSKMTDDGQIIPDPERKVQRSFKNEVGAGWSAEERTARYTENLQIIKGGYSTLKCDSL